MSTDRDKELDALQADLRKPVPHIESPDEMTPGQGAMCFLDRLRVCGPDCASYIGENPLPSERCLVLCGIAKGMQAVEEFFQIRKESSQVHIAPVIPPVPPPDPFGGKRGKE